MKAICVALLGPLALAACAAGAEHAASRVDSAGIEIVTSPGVDLPAPWTLTQVGTFGGDPGDTLLISAAEDLKLIAGTDRFYVLDRRASRVAMVDTVGRLVGAFGKEGDGPGEFRSAFAVSADDSGTVTLLDMGRRRLISFSATGEPLGDEPIPSAHVGTFRLGHLGHDLVMDRRQRDSTGVPNAIEVVIVSRGDSGVLGRHQLPGYRSAELHACGVQVEMPAMALFAPRLHWSSAGDWLALVTDAEYDIRVFHSGSTPRRVRRPIPPREATEALARQDIGEEWEFGIGDRDCTVAPDEVIEQMGVADWVPAIQGVLIDADGWLRVQRFSVGDEPVLVDIFNPDGEYSGTMTGEHPMPDAATGNYVATALEDSLGLPTIVVSRIERRDS